MKAIVYTTYGTPEVLKLAEVPKPVPGKGEVLVKVHAASVNSWDWDLVTGKPYLYRLLFGLSRPKHPIIGSDIAGTVEAVGEGVEKFKPGEEVVGDISAQGFGAFAEYASASSTALTLKSNRMSFEEAAAFPQAATLALQSLQLREQVRPGQKILINGAGGGVGTFAVQLAKLWGAEVTAVDKGGKLSMLRKLGADHVIDYTKEDFSSNGRRYDRIIDMVARKSVFDCKRTLSPDGIYAVVGGKISTMLQVGIFGSLISARGQKIGMLIHEPNKGLDFLTELFESGKIKAVIGRSYPLEEAADAVQSIGEGTAKGKLIITM